MGTFSKVIQRLFNQSGIRVQILSDLHLEVGQQYWSYTFPVSAPFLLLGGDIGHLIDYDGYLKFLEVQVSRYQKVFLVLGNHEFYGLDYESGLATAQRLSEDPKLADTLVLLNKGRWNDTKSNLTVIGCTLWSLIPEDASSIVQAKVSDFKKINGWTIEKHNEIHTEEASWLREEVVQIQSAGRRLLVATHHAPCMRGTSRPEHSNNSWTPAFATDLLDQEGWDGINIWVFGHTHYSTDLRRNGIRVVANQRGYVLPGTMVGNGNGKKSKTDPHSFDAAMTVTV